MCGRAVRLGALRRRSVGRAPVTLEISFDRDTTVREDQADTEFSTSAQLTTRGDAGNRMNVMIHLDLSGIPAGSTILSATLQLTQAFTVSAADATLSLHRVLAANAGWLETATWNYADGESGADRWAGDAEGDGGADAGCSVPGTDYVAEAIGSFVIPASQEAGTIYNVDLDLDQLQALMADNHGLVMTCDLNAARTVWSRNAATVANRPKLTVVYE